MDASVWVSALVPGDVHHATSRAWLQAEEEGDRILVAPALVLPEVAAAISRRTGRASLGRRAIAALLRVRSLRLVALDPELAENAARLAADRALRGADAVYVAVARRLGRPLVTWDREQIERSRGVVEVAMPRRDA